MKVLIDGINRSYPAREAAEAVAHIGDIRFAHNGGRKFIGLADNVKLTKKAERQLRMYDSPYNNVVCYCFQLDTEGLYFMIDGAILRPSDLLDASGLLAELRAIAKEQV